MKYNAIIKKKLDNFANVNHFFKLLKSVRDWQEKFQNSKILNVTCVAKHLHRTGNLYAPECTLCSKGSVMDSRHLFECPDNTNRDKDR